MSKVSPINEQEISFPQTSGLHNTPNSSFDSLLAIEANKLDSVEIELKINEINIDEKLKTYEEKYHLNDLSDIEKKAALDILPLKEIDPSVLFEMANNIHLRNIISISFRRFKLYKRLFNEYNLDQNVQSTIRKAWKEKMGCKIWYCCWEMVSKWKNLWIIGLLICTIIAIIVAWSWDSKAPLWVELISLLIVLIVSTSIKLYFNRKNRQYQKYYDSL